MFVLPESGINEENIIFMDLYKWEYRNRTITWNSQLNQ